MLYLTTAAVRVHPWYQLGVARQGAYMYSNICIIHSCGLHSYWYHQEVEMEPLSWRPTIVPSIVTTSIIGSLIPWLTHCCTFGPVAIAFHWQHNHPHQPESCQWSCISTSSAYVGPNFAKVIGHCMQLLFHTPCPEFCPLSPSATQSVEWSPLCSFKIIAVIIIQRV